LYNNAAAKYFPDYLIANRGKINAWKIFWARI